MTTTEDRITASLIANWQAQAAIRASRKARLDADPVMIDLRRRRAETDHPVNSGADLLADLVSGVVPLRQRLNSLMRARTALIDGFPHIAREHLRQAAIARRTRWAICA